LGSWLREVLVLGGSVGQALGKKSSQENPRMYSYRFSSTLNGKNAEWKSSSSGPFRRHRLNLLTVLDLKYSQSTNKRIAERSW